MGGCRGLNFQGSGLLVLEDADACFRSAHGSLVEALVSLPFARNKILACLVLQHKRFKLPQTGKPEVAI